MSDKTQILIAMALYIAAVIGIGIRYAKKASESSSNFLIGGRSLGPWMTAMAAEASDMSGWILMGLPGVAYWSGASDAVWTAIGLLIGTYINWLFVAKRLRVYSHIAGDSITIPEFLSKRFKENKKVLMTVAAVFILAFFTIYAASCFVTVGKLFTTLFGIKYAYMMILGALFVVIYTLFGGFLAESASDFMQGIVMIAALVLASTMGVIKAGGISEVIENAKQIPGFFDFFGIANPIVKDGVQQISGGKPLFGAPSSYGFITIISTLSWGLGYFGMPHVLLKFMAIRSPKEIKLSRRIATVWCAISLVCAVGIGIIGRAVFPVSLLTKTDSENIFVLMSTDFFLPFIAGLVMAGILAATISSSDSYLLIAASAFSKNIYQGILKKNASDKQVLLMSRITLIVIAVLAAIIALDEKNQIIFTVVAFAWAGFGATFGPTMLFSLFWKKITHTAAVAGMVSGGVSVIFWKTVLKPLGGIFGIYELLPAFLLSSIVIIVVSQFTKKPSDEVLEAFEKARTGEIA